MPYLKNMKMVITSFCRGKAVYIFVILMTSRVIWYTWKLFWSILKFWPPLDLCVTPTGKGPNRPKFCQNVFCPITTSNLSITLFRQNGTWVLLLNIYLDTVEAYGNIFINFWRFWYHICFVTRGKLYSWQVFRYGDIIT